MRLDNEDHLVSQVFLVRMVSLELMVLMGKTVFQENLVHVVFKVLKDLLVSQFQVHKVLKVTKGLKVKKALKVFLEEMASMVQRAQRWAQSVSRRARLRRQETRSAAPS